MLNLKSKLNKLTVAGGILVLGIVGCLGYKYVETDNSVEILPVPQVEVESQAGVETEANVELGKEAADY